MDQLLVSASNITVTHLQKTILKDVNIEILKGEHIAVIGNSGAGKSALLAVLASKLAITKGKLKFHFSGDSSNLENDARKHVALVEARHNFKNLSNTSTFYYQQRFNSSDAGDSPTARQHLKIIQRNYDGVWNFDKVSERLKLDSFLDKQLIKLSNGETKRLTLASALLKNPELLLLDQPFTGLDTTSRSDLNNLFKEISNSGITVIIATDVSELPDVIAKVIVLDGGSIVREIDKYEISELKQVDYKLDDVFKYGDVKVLLTANAQAQYQIIARLNDVTIRYSDKLILDNVSWEILPGERWSLSGPNGAGKSTLLSLIYGDNPQAYANDITLFDKKRGTGESIWDIKSKCGFVSPELFQFFPLENSCAEVIESGFYDSLGLFRKSNPIYTSKIKNWLVLLGIEKYASVPLRNIPAGAQRLCLLARALVKSPPLLILDEPCQGLDGSQQRRFKNLIDAIFLNSDLTLIYVTHYESELPLCVNRYFKLANGRVVNN